MEGFDIIQFLEGLLLPVVTAIAGWMTGRRKRKNDFLSELQNSIDLLSRKNAELLKEVLALNDIVLKLTNENAALKAEVKAVRQENKEMSDEISRLREKLDGVKTITRVKKDESK